VVIIALLTWWTLTRYVHTHPPLIGSHVLRRCTHELMPCCGPQLHSSDCQLPGRGRGQGERAHTR
jgi:hypothetical protein